MRRAFSVSSGYSCCGALHAAFVGAGYAKDGLKNLNRVKLNQAGAVGKNILDDGGKVKGAPIEKTPTFNAKNYIDDVIKKDPEITQYISKVKRSAKGDGSFVYMKRPEGYKDAVYFISDSEPDFADEVYRTLKAENNIIYKPKNQANASKLVTSNLLDGKEVIGRYQDGGTIKIDGADHTVHKMSYGQYYAEPKGWQGGETDGFAPGTKWLEKNKDGQFEIIAEDDFTRQGVKQAPVSTGAKPVQPSFTEKLKPVQKPVLGAPIEKTKDLASEKLANQTTPSNK